MCGRFTLIVELEELMFRFHVGPFSRYQPRYNVAPGQEIISIIHDGEVNRMGLLRWGLIPQWAKDAKIANQTMNARAETIAEKPAYRVPFQRKRCLIPADGFYEWKRSAGNKQPMRIIMKNRELFAMAGLYDTWLDPQGNKISTCTIITTQPNELMQDIHNRMPVILRPEDEALWLDRSVQDTALLQSLLQPYDASEMTAYPVHPMVGNVRNDTPECIKELK